MTTGIEDHYPLRKLNNRKVLDDGWDYLNDPAILRKAAMTDEMIRRCGLPPFVLELGKRKVQKK
jgi:hypothetical protein